jgi:predicted outer membrane repeat protein
MSNLTLLNATFVDNIAGSGGAIYNSYSNPTFHNLTLTGNSASNNGGAIANEYADPTIANVIAWGNTATGSGDQIYDDGDSDTNISYSVVEGGFPSGSNIITADPRLRVLGDHGGHTQVIPLRFDSSAIDSGDDDTCSLADQRQLSRNGQGAACDIGAYEFQPVLYVTTSGRTDGLCQGWSFACELQYALSQADWGQQIWVKEGTYKPATVADRTATFQLPGAVHLYGGFAGTETVLEQRDWQARPTILSGDLGAQGDNNDNSYHVVYARGSVFGDGMETILDGFTISHGNADQGPDDNSGGGILLDGANPIIRNVVISGNAAVYGGGAAAVNNTQPVFQGVIFTGNSASNGGGLYSEESDPKLLKTLVDNNVASGNGGGIYAEVGSQVELNGVDFTDNSAGTDGGGMFLVSTLGGAMSQVTFVGNQATRDGGGLFLFFNSDPTLSQVSFAQNEARRGGGMAVSRANPQLDGLNFVDNEAWDAGGGLYISSSDLNMNQATFTANRAGAGGGIYASGSSPTITEATFSQNETFYSIEGTLPANGGGMLAHNGGAPTLTDVTFVENVANHNGGGLANIGSDPRLENVTFSANAGDYGGGMYSSDADPIMANVTFSHNSAYSGGGLYAAGNSYLKVVYSTFTGNRALGIAGYEPGRGGGIYLDESETPLIRNTILWDNSAASNGGQIYNAQLYSGWGTQWLESSVVQGGCPADMTCTSIIDADPVLGQLGDHGGQTMTIPLGAGSSALDEAEGTFTDCLDTDQRGIGRPQGNYCDIGAFESRLYNLTVNKAGGGDGTVSGPGIDCGAGCSQDYPEASQITLTANPGAAAIFSGWSGACNGHGDCTVTMSAARQVTASFEPIPPGSHVLTVSLEGDGAGTVSGPGINCFDGPGADCIEIYAGGTQVNLTASPGPNASFAGWSGACNSGSGICSLTMNQPRSVTAAFAGGVRHIHLPMIIK